ncbi:MULTISPECIES: arabinosyltransferase domain-containing protein [Dietzia]|uniref:arabinosyltransferase domain-containing protein n=1 Tax=Dietzia TaxID=37914 RepID=UPI000D08E1A0|nr:MULTISPECIES: arabinosyltransferase domain-containing protein [Dietzia]AVM64643.1 arabinosyltransferase [Dietzia sp. oral taxon 368]MCT1712900.1 arabinosyltransferase domain-containing protein [Dietzia cinnamea]MCT2265706.1 arabinosyltransferase domain-containing protein [Dietzia cinnamea]MCT2275444.1 arabinosyltransferase domain-containing protein [Dietzia cinnamea]
MPSTASEVPVVPERTQSGPRWGIIAAVSGLIGILLAIVVPLLPVTQTTTSISWPEGGTLDPVTAPLVAYYPLDIEVGLPCSAVTELREQGREDGVLVSTAPREAGEDAGARGLMVSVAGPNVEVRSRNVLIASAPTEAVAAPGGCSSIHVIADSGSIGAEFTGLSVDGQGVGGRIDRDLRPQVVGVFTDLEGAAPEGMSVDITVDSRYTTQATALKQIAIVVGILAIIVALVALHRLDLRDGRLARRILPPGWWKPRPLDVLVVGTLLVWHVIGANTADDGYILTEARAAVSSGYMPEVFRYYGAPYAPFGMPYYLYTAMSAVSLGSIWLRLPALLLGIGSWILLSREVIPRLGIAARRAPAVRWSTAAVFLAFWLTYNNGLRPEPIIAFGVLATWVSLERALATGRLLPAATGFIIGGLTLSAAPTGTFCIAVIIAASRPLLLLIIRRARRDGWVPTVAPLLAAGLGVLHLIFLDQPLVTTLQSSALLGDVGPTGRWFEEVWRYEWLMNPTPDGSLARRFAVLAMFLSLITCAAILFRKGRVPGVAIGPARRIVGLAAISIAFMALNPTKWTHHFGAFATIGAALAALVTMAVLPTATRSLRNRMLFLAAVFFVLALSFTSTNGWWYISIYGIPWGGAQPSVAGVTLSSVFVGLMLLALLAALVLHYREPFLTPTGPQRPDRDRGPLRRFAREISRAPLGLAAALVVVIIVASMAAAVRNQYPAYSVGLQNLRALSGKPCGIADAVLAEPDANAGLLAPMSEPRDQLEAGAEAIRFEPDGIPTDLTATQDVDTDTPGTGESSDTTSTTAGTEGGVRAGEGINGSHAVLPFGLDPARVPVLGSHQTGAQFNAETTTDWYPLPARSDENPLVTIAVAGSFAPDALRVEYATGGGTEIAGSVLPLDIGPAPAWRNLRVPVDTLPDDTTAIRLVVRDLDPDPSRWIAFTPPRMPELVTMQELVGDTRPVLPDWAVAFHVPCLRPFDEYAGIHELPEYRVLPDRGLAVSSTNTWQSWDGGGPLGFIELLLEGETVPTYLEHDWDRDWGSLVRYTPLVPEAREATVDHGEAVRSGLWNGGPLAR